MSFYCSPSSIDPVHILRFVLHQQVHEQQRPVFKFGSPFIWLSMVIENVRVVYFFNLIHACFLTLFIIECELVDEI